MDSHGKRAASMPAHTRPFSEQELWGLSKALRLPKYLAASSRPAPLLRAGKILQQAQRAYAFAAEERLSPGAPLPPSKPKPAFDPVKLERLASSVPEPADWAQTLAVISPLRPDTQSPTKILRELYKPGERVIVFTGDQQSQGNYLLECPPADQTLHPIPEEYLRHDEGVWFLVQPVDGDMHANPRTGNASRRSEEAVTSWRYAVLESDSAPWRKWLAALAQLPLPIAAIYSSGGRSIHALVLVEDDSKSRMGPSNPRRTATHPCNNRSRSAGLDRHSA